MVYFFNNFLANFGLDWVAWK